MHTCIHLHRSVVDSTSIGSIQGKYYGNVDAHTLCAHCADIYLVLFESRPMLLNLILIDVFATMQLRSSCTTAAAQGVSESQSRYRRPERSEPLGRHGSGLSPFVLNGLALSSHLK